MENDDSFSYKQLPQLLDKTKQIYAKLNSMTYEEQKALWGCNEALAEEAHHRLKRSLEDRPVQALSAYKGLQYIHMGSKLFTKASFSNFLLPTNERASYMFNFIK